MIAPYFVDVYGIIAGASNIKVGGNPDFTVEDFLKIYPQFGKLNEDGTPLIPEPVMKSWLAVAQASIHKKRYGELWQTAMCLFIAHWLTLYLQSVASPDDNVSKIINAGVSKGIQQSKSAGDLSVSYDFSMLSADFAGWGTYQQTAYGQQFITIAKLVSKGGITVW